MSSEVFKKKSLNNNAELEALNAKIEKIEIIKKALVDEKDTLEVINRQQKAIVESQAASASESKANKENIGQACVLDEKRVKAAEQLVKSYASLNAQFKPLLANESEAYKLLENMTYAAGGLGVNLKNGTTEAGKLVDKLCASSLTANGDFGSSSFLIHSGRGSKIDISTVALSDDSVVGTVFNAIGGTIVYGELSQGTNVTVTTVSQGNAGGRVYTGVQL